MKTSYGIRAAVTASVLGALCGCTTTYVGQKIEANGKLAKPSGGVPFVMTRPEYVVNITADANDATKAVYTLAAQYVPDASQRFTIALDPALFVNGKFDLDFGEHGNLTGAATTTTTRVVDTFGSFVGLALKISALLDAATTLETYKAVLDANSDSRCTGVIAGGSATAKQGLQAMIKDLEAEAEREVGDKTNAKRARAELVGERLHYQDAAQRECMTAVVEAVKKVQEDPAEARYTAAIKASEAAAKDNAELSLLNAQIKSEVAALNDDALTKIADGLTGRAVPFDLAMKAAREGAQFAQLRLAGRFARFMVGMGPEVWRARHLGYIERRLARCQVETLLKASTSPCSDPAVAALKVEWSNTLGEATVVARLAKVDVQLAQVPQPAAAGRGRESAVDDHVKLREERDKLQARIDQVRADLISKNKTISMGPEAPKAAKVEPRSNVAVSLVKRSYVDAVNAKPASFSGLPEFVLVLEPDDKGGVSAMPTPVGASK